jgi:hypothetical protein
VVGEEEAVVYKVAEAGFEAADTAVVGPAGRKAEAGFEAGRILVPQARNRPL